MASNLVKPFDGRFTVQVANVAYPSLCSDELIHSLDRDGHDAGKLEVSSLP